MIQRNCYQTNAHLSLKTFDGVFFAACLDPVSGRLGWLLLFGLMLLHDIGHFLHFGTFIIACGPWPGQCLCASILVNLRLAVIVSLAHHINSTAIVSLACLIGRLKLTNLLVHHGLLRLRVAWWLHSKIVDWNAFVFALSVSTSLGVIDRFYGLNRKDIAFIFSIFSGCCTPIATCVDEFRNYQLTWKLRFENMLTCCQWRLLIYSIVISC